MKANRLIVPLIFAASSVHANACWSEWERDEQWLLRAGTCTENVSIPDITRMCKSRVKSDTDKTAASCPTTAKVLVKNQIVTASVEYRCMGLAPPASGGKANIFYYGLRQDPDQLDMLRTLCVQFGGKWEQAN